MDSQGRVVSCERSVTPRRYAERNKEDLIYSCYTYKHLLWYLFLNTVNKN